MTRLRRPIYQRAEGADEDRWCLVYDTDQSRLFVEHESTSGDMRGDGSAISIEETELATFLREYGPEPQVLTQLLGAIFNGEAAAR